MWCIQEGEHAAVKLFMMSKVQWFCFENCTTEGRGGEKRGSANFDMKHTEPLTSWITRVYVWTNIDAELHENVPYISGPYWYSSTVCRDIFSGMPPPPKKRQFQTDEERRKKWGVFSSPPPPSFVMSRRALFGKRLQTTAAAPAAAEKQNYIAGRRWCSVIFNSLLCLY